MKKIFAFAVFLLILILGLKLVGQLNLQALPNAENDVTIHRFVVSARSPVVYKPSKVGINLGRWTLGTEQLANNPLLNPGLEGKIERTIVIVSQFNEFSFSDEVGLGYPNNYWKGANFTIKSGTSKGKTGAITESLNSGKNGLPQYFTSEPLPPLTVGAVVVLTKVDRLAIFDLFAINSKALVQADPFEKRPGSQGEQSLKLSPTRTRAAKIALYFDTIAKRSNRMRHIKGPWQLSFFAKSENELSELQISLMRGEHAFFDKKFKVTPEWKEYHIDFTSEEKALERAAARLLIQTTQPSQSIWLDDITLLSKNANKTAFREEVIKALLALQPSYLREFPPLGNTFDNHIAPSFERKFFVYNKASGKKEEIYNYSLIEFLDLCQIVKANPWLILPPTFSDFECKQFGLFLAKYAKKARFSDVIVEFGAENWNWLNRPLSIPYPKIHGEVADHCFQIVKKTNDMRSNLRFFVNGQFSTPNTALQFIEKSKLADGLSLNAYFFETLNKATPDNQILNILFKQETQLPRVLSDILYSRGKSFAISEVNLHTLKGDAKSYERDRLVAGNAAGSALAKKILDALFAGVDPILVNGLAQFDTPAWEVDAFVPLWGVVQNFGPPLTFRPTGLAMIMLNRVIEGNMYAVNAVENDQKPLFTIAAFKNKERWTAAIVSSSDQAEVLEITFPDDERKLPSHTLTLTAPGPFSTNEFDSQVLIVESKTSFQGRQCQVKVPAFGFVTFIPKQLQDFGKEKGPSIQRS